MCASEAIIACLIFGDATHKVSKLCSAFFGLGDGTRRKGGSVLG